MVINRLFLAVAIGILLFISCVHAAPGTNEGELRLWTFNASNVSSVPNNIYTASKDIPYTTNVSLTYNSTSRSIDSRCWNGNGGETYITGAYPTVNENLTFTMGVDSNSEWSYGYMHTSVAYVGVRHVSDGSYDIESYWTTDQGTQSTSTFRIPATSVVNNRVTVSIRSYDSNRTNVISSGSTLNIATPYATDTARKLPYTNVIQPLIYEEFYASGTGGWVNVHLYNITQSIPRNTITPYARNDIMAFGFDYPVATENKNATDFLISRGQNASVYVSETNLENPGDIAYDNSLFAKGFEQGIHFYPGLTSESLVQAEGTIDSQIAEMNATLGLLPVSWSCHQNQDNITHAVYAYSKYGTLYRNGPMGMSFISNVDTLSNATWAWWSVSSAHGAVSPCFTHQTDVYPAIAYSIDPNLFRTFVTNLNSKGINLTGFSKWYCSSMAQNATANLLQDDANQMKFQLNTSGGYPVNVNVKTRFSPTYLYFNNVSMPFNRTSDGIQFKSAGNGTYNLRNTTLVIPSITWNNPANITYGTALSSTQLNAVASVNGTSVPGTFMYTPAEGTVLSAGTYTLHVDFTPIDTANYTIASKNVTINVSENPFLPAANFTVNVTSGNAPLSVQFNDRSINATAWSWNFGDGQTSLAQNPTHTYSSAGTYTVSLNASNAAGYNILTKSNLISVTTAPPTNSLVVYYAGNLSGNSVVDLSGYNNNGVATSATQGTNPTTGANYINFNGVTSKIDVPNNAQTNISSPVTIEFIGSINTFTTYGSLVSKYKDSTTGWYLSCSSVSPYNKVRFGVNLMDGREINFDSNSGLVAGQAYDIVVTYDNSTAHIYVNGVDDNSRTWSSPIKGGPENLILAYGNSINGLNSCNCSMYTFRLYNRALSSSEVLQNYNNWSKPPSSPSDSITAIKKMAYGDGGLPRYMGSYAMKQSGSGMSLVDSNMYSLGSVLTPYYQDNGGASTDYTLSNSLFSGVKWKTYYAPGSSATLSFSGNNRNRLENISLSNNSLDLSNSVTYSAQSLVTQDAVPVTGNAFQFYGDGLNTIAGNTVQAYTDNGLIQNDCIINSTGGFVYNYYQKRTAGATRSNSIQLPLSSPQLTPMPCPSGYLGSLSFAIHADAQDPDSLKTMMYGTNDTGNPVYGTKGYIGHGLICTWGAFAASSSSGSGFDDPAFKSTLNDIYAHGFEIVPHNVIGKIEDGTPTLATTSYYLPWYFNNYSSRNWIDHGLNHGNRNTGLKSLGLDKTSQYYIGNLLRQYGFKYAWAYQDVYPYNGLSTSQTHSIGLPYDLVWTNTNFTWDDGTPMYEWTSTWAPDSTSLNYFTNDAIQTLINNYGVCFWHDYTAEDDAPFENYYYTKGNPDMINQTYDNLLLNISEQKDAGKLWNPTVSQYIDYWRAACNVECKCTGQNTYTLINHNSAAIPGYAMHVTGSYTVKLDGTALNTRTNGADTVFWMNLTPGTHLLTLGA